MSRYFLAAFLSAFAFAALPSAAEACEKHAAAGGGEAAGCDPANCPMAKEHGGECPMAKGGECPMAKKGDGEATCGKCGKCAAGTCDGSKCDAAKCDGSCGKHGSHGKKADAKAQPAAKSASAK